LNFLAFETQGYIVVVVLM